MISMNAQRLPVGWLVLLGTLIAIAPLSIDMYLPAFPAIEAALGKGHGGAEYTLASFFVGIALGQLAYGPLSDRFGRKPPLYAGLTIYILASLACAFVDDLGELAAWRFIQAIGGCSGMVIARAVVRDRCAAQEAARAFSLLILVMGVAPILAPLFGGWISGALGWRALFATLAGFGLLCLLLVRFGLAESRDTRHAAPLTPAGVAEDYLSLLRSRAFLGYSLTAALASAGMFAYIAGSPGLLIGLYHIPPEHFGWVFGINALGFIAASQINARLLRKTPLTTLLRRSLRLTAFSAAVLCVLALVAARDLPPLVPLLASLFVFMASLGLVNPNANAAAMASHGQIAGTASALIGAVQFAGASLSGALLGLAGKGSATPLVTVMALCGVGAWLTHRWLISMPARRAGSAHAR
jgi:DHA1 family bicyclomycin/chloramphenicol resistance-like MFS transporter